MDDMLFLNSISERIQSGGVPSIGWCSKFCNFKTPIYTDSVEALEFYDVSSEPL